MDTSIELIEYSEAMGDVFFHVHQERYGLFSIYILHDSPDGLVLVSSQVNWSMYFAKTVVYARWKVYAYFHHWYMLNERRFDCFGENHHESTD